MSTPLDGKRVLLVDDDADILTSMQAAFEPTGAVIETANNGNAAVALAEKNDPDVIVLDMMMPGRTGLDVLAELRADDELADTPVIVLTARAQASDREAASTAGADRFLPKPFSPIALANVVRELLGRGR